MAIHIHIHDAEGPAHDPKNGQFTSGPGGSGVAHHTAMKAHHEAKMDEHRATRMKKAGEAHWASPEGSKHWQAHTEAAKKHMTASNSHSQASEAYRRSNPSANAMGNKAEAHSKNAEKASASANSVPRSGPNKPIK